MINKITIVRGDDWEGIYVDGVCIAQDHRVTVRDLLVNLDLDFEIKEPDMNWLEYEGYLPDLLEDVKFSD